MLKVIESKEHHRTKAARIARKQVVDILERAKSLLSVPFGWNKKGVLGPAWETTGYTNEDACSFDCEGALLRAHGEIRGEDIYGGEDIFGSADECDLIVAYIDKKIMPLMGFRDVYDLGMFELDQDDKRPVLALLDKALIRANRALSKVAP